ncbi:DUF4920 domain-containing protein [Myroides sp. WP-1]|uniref:DUF4920 domain-containing protein n=1 Tax=Myroides sp. WP-1 TaxID=2759944 RepID=UPI0015FB83DD|nr:DUF4920 domain-containing protein [Myroides sp. WP-1]MBB1140445.1 DUF4920 domain-containing protein [Myroides sp. WP-1]
MKHLVLTLGLLALVTVSCVKKSDQKNELETVVSTSEKEYETFGQDLDKQQKVLSKEAMWKEFEQLKEGDTLRVSFASTIKEVCQKKGCWMQVDLDQEKSSFVRFKDYGFFAPMNAGGHEVVMQGKAFVSVVSVDELKHYAKDAGKSEVEIEAITEPKITYAFEADGIAIAK